MDEEVLCFVTFPFVVTIYTFRSLAVWLLFHYLRTGRIISGDYSTVHNALALAPGSL